MRETAPANGLRPQGNQYILPNIGRWAFILVTFAYLLAVALALFEAVNLQTMVKKLAGDEVRARDAMLALDEHRGWQGSSNDVRYAAMVVSLDKLKAATRGLALLDGSFNFPDSGDEAGDGGVPPTDVFKRNVDQLEFALDDLQRTVGDAAPRIGIATSIANLGRVVDGLRGYTGPQDDPAEQDITQATILPPSSGAIVNGGMQQPALDQKSMRMLEDTKRLQDQLGDLVAILDDLRQVPTEASAELANIGLENVRQEVTAFSKAVATGRMNYGETLVKLKPPGDGTVGAKPTEVPAVVPSRREPAEDAGTVAGATVVKTVQKVSTDIGNEIAVNRDSLEKVGGQATGTNEPEATCFPRIDVDGEPVTVCKAETKLGDPITVALPADAFVHENRAPLAYTAVMRKDNSANDETVDVVSPGWLRFDPVLRTFCGNPTATEDQGEYTISVRATDPNGAFAEGIFRLVVAGEPPEQRSEGASEAERAVACPLPDYQQRVKGLETSLIDFENTLLKAEPNLAVAKLLSVHIVGIGEAAESLRRLKPGPDLRYRDPRDERVGSAAVAAFKQQQQILTETADGLEKVLGNYSPALAVSRTLGDDPEAYRKGDVIWSEFEALERFEPVLMPLRGFEAYGLPLAVAGFGFHPQRMATLGNEVLTLVLVLVIGAIGSLIFMTKRQLGAVLQGASVRHKPDIGFSWYLFRPIFGVVVAFAIYLLYKAGQIALGGGAGDEAFAGINVPILSVIALFAGLLSWQALEMIQGRGTTWLGSVERRALWATGLDNALRTLNRSLRECADQVGRSVGQVERWIGCRDKVTPEMQDRLITWTGRSKDELFSENQPKDAEAARPMWARGLRRAMTSNGRALDAKALAELLGEDAERVEGWVKCELQVSPAMQWRLIDVLDVRHSDVFEHDDRAVDRWAVGLRRTLEQSGLRGAEDLASRIGSSVARVRAWMELQELVPLEMQAATARVLNVGERQLFADDKPNASGMMWATQLRERMREKGFTVEALAKGVDADPELVRTWRDLNGEGARVAPATQDKIAEVLDEPKDLIFGSVPEGDALRWGTGLTEALDSENWDVATLAEKLDSDPKLVERWVALNERVPPPVQEAMATVLETSRDALFSDKK